MMYNQLLTVPVAKFNKRQGPRVGDFVIMPKGAYRRFAYDWGEEMQIADNDAATFFFTKDGYMDFKGGLDLAIPKTKLVLTDVVKQGVCRFASHKAWIDCRVYWCKE
jgi:hypothetical protein